MEINRITEPVFREYVASGFITAVEVTQLPNGPFLIEGTGRDRVFRLREARGDDRTFTNLARLGKYLKKLHVGRFNVVLSEVYDEKQMTLQ